MIVTFNKEYLRELYLRGEGGKKHRYQPSIVKRYKRCIDYMIQAKDIEELKLLPSLHYKVLSGDKAGVSAIRINDQYRIEFIVLETTHPVCTVCNVIDLSNHYE